VDVEAPAGVIEKAFGVTINRYQVENRIAFSNDRDPAIPAHLLNILHSVGGLNSVRVLHPMSHGPEPLMREYAPGPVAGQVVSRSANGDGSRRPQHLTTSRGAANIASKPENGKPAAYHQRQLRPDGYF